MGQSLLAWVTPQVKHFNNHRQFDIEDLLFDEGWGTRRECRDLCRQGRARFLSLPGEREGTLYSVDGVEYRAQRRLVIALNKPLGYECSTRPTHYPSVLELLPQRFIRRNIQPVGRLDAHTTGLLLLTDDGQLNHRLSHPSFHLPKTYLLETETAWEPSEVEILLQGVDLRHDGRVRAIKARLVEPHWVEITLDRGLYHQVRRMAGALGKRCVSLMRIGFGPWNLQQLGLSPGGWTEITLTDPQSGDTIGLD